MKKLSGLIIFVLMFTSVSFAAAPKTLNFQGRLVTQDGTPVQGIQTITFKIFDDPSAGTLYWQDTLSNVVLDSSGVFNVILGNNPSNPLDKDTGGNTRNYFNNKLWVEITYSGQIFNPRQELSTAPYSFQAVFGSVPIGTVLAYASLVTPEGFLECAGQDVSRIDYYDLYQVIGTTFGAGGSLTFKVPDLRGQFIRGWAHGSTEDPDRASRANRGDGTIGDNVGTRQSYELQSHRHQVPVSYKNFALGGNGVWSTDVPGDYTYYTGGNETRSRNVYMMYIIRAK